MIELIRSGNIATALQFASEELAPRAEEHPDLLPELERTMALLAFELPRSTNTTTSTAVGRKAAASVSLEAPPHIAELLQPAQRLRTAGELNAAILASQSQGREPKLPRLLKMLCHGEGLMAGPSEGKINYPHLDLLGSFANETTTSAHI